MKHALGFMAAALVLGLSASASAAKCTASLQGPYYSRATLSFVMHYVASCDAAVDELIVNAELVSPQKTLTGSKTCYGASYCVVGLQDTYAYGTWYFGNDITWDDGSAFVERSWPR